MRKIPFHYLVLAALPLYVACASDDGDDPAGGGSAGSSGAATTAGTGPGTAGAPVGTAGTLGTAGTPGTGGAPGTAGAPTTGGSPGTAGAPGTAGSGGAPAGGCVAPMAATGSISTFEMNVANQLSTGTDVWSASPAGSTATAMAGALLVKQTMGSWGSVSTLLNKGSTCFNLDGKYTGIKFKISSPTNTSIKFIVVTPETKADSSHFGKVLTITATPTETPVLFTELAKAGFGAGMALPADYLPSQHVIGIGFGVMMETELMDITLDDVTFY